MQTTNASNDIDVPAKVGAWLFALWGVRHVWVGAEGVRQYLTFLFAMVVSGVIELNAGTVGGPVLWFLAILITPWGLPKVFRSGT
jgi:hypothetical protein